MLLASPAKVNLHLEVLGRRPDGYHEIRSLLQLVDLCDRVLLRSTPREIQVAAPGAGLPEGPGNVAYAAATLLREASGVRAGAAITIEKRIPVAAGLGGGSSNAAAVLAGLNRLWGLGWGRERLMELGGRIGSDVPFFLGPPLARVEGRGEIVVPMPPLPPAWVVVGDPGIAVASGWAYGRLNLELTLPRPASSIWRSIVRGDVVPALPDAFNSLEAAVLPAHPAVGRLKRALQEGGAVPALMSGSGSAVFGLVPDEALGRVLAARLLALGAAAFCCRTLERNPLLDLDPASPGR